MAQDADLPRSLAGLSGEILARRLSPVEVVRALLEHIEADDTNSFITVTAERALERARWAEREILAGRYRGPLHGVPVALKDIIYTRGVRTTMGSGSYSGHVPDHSATVARKLEEAGYVLIGKTNTHEFAYGPTGDRSYFGANEKSPRYAQDHGRVQRRLGGGGRGKPLLRRARLGHGRLHPYSRGPLRYRRHEADLRAGEQERCLPTLMELGPCRSHHPHRRGQRLDAERPGRPRPGGPLLRRSSCGRLHPRTYAVASRGASIGIPRGFFFDHVDGEVKARVREAVEVFRSLGAEMWEVEIPNLWDTLHAHRLILGAEAYAVHQERLENEPETFGEEVGERLMDGERLKAYRYANARRRGVLAAGEFDRALQGVDVLLTPTLPIVATEIGQREVNIGGYEESVRSALTRFTGPTDLTGHPSLSLPCGHTGSGLPVGMQLIGRPFDEATLYRFGAAYERTTAGEPTAPQDDSRRP